VIKLSTHDGDFCFQPKPDLITCPEFISRPNHFIFVKSSFPDVPVCNNSLRPVRLLSALDIVARRKPTTDRLFDPIANIA